MVLYFFVPMLMHCNVHCHNCPVYDFSLVVFALQCQIQQKSICFECTEAPLRLKMGIISLLISLSLLAVCVLGQTTNIEDLASKNADFATRLYSTVSSTSDDNVVVSTLGATLALATLAAGAGGTSRSELLQGIGVASVEKDREILLQQLRETTAQNQAIGLFTSQQVEVDPGFSSRVKQFYAADVKNVNYANGVMAKESINDYVRGRVGSKIIEMVESVDQQTIAMLINAAYFSGKKQAGKYEEFIIIFYN